MTILPAGLLSTVMSKNTLGLAIAIGKLRCGTTASERMSTRKLNTSRRRRYARKYNDGQRCVCVWRRREIVVSVSRYARDYRLRQNGRQSPPHDYRYTPTRYKYTNINIYFFFRSPIVRSSFNFLRFFDKYKINVFLATINLKRNSSLAPVGVARIANGECPAAESIFTRHRLLIVYAAVIRQASRIDFGPIGGRKNRL